RASCSLVTISWAMNLHQFAEVLIYSPRYPFQVTIRAVSIISNRIHSVIHSVISIERVAVVFFEHVPNCKPRANCNETPPNRGRNYAIGETNATACSKKSADGALEPVSRRVYEVHWIPYHIQIEIHLLAIP